MLNHFHAVNPYDDFPLEDYPLDLNGFCDADHNLREIIALVKPRTVAEVGVWKGNSAFVICNEALKFQPKFQLLAVDTWLGASEFWTDLEDPLRYGELRMEHGYPRIYYQFIANTIHNGYAGMITPLPLDSLSAAQVILAKGIKFDLVHLDASHEYPAVCADIEAWHHRTPVIIGHDYSHESVRDAVNDKFTDVREFDAWWFALTRDYTDV